MRDSTSPCRITRVVDGDDRDVQLAQLQAVMQRIQLALHDIPPLERIYIGNALLNLAVQKMIGDEGVKRTASILMRLSDVVHTHPTPPPAAEAVDLGELHS